MTVYELLISRGAPVLQDDRAAAQIVCAVRKDAVDVAQLAASLLIRPTIASQLLINGIAREDEIREWRVPLDWQSTVPAESLADCVKELTREIGHSFICSPHLLRACEEVDAAAFHHAINHVSDLVTSTLPGRRLLAALEFGARFGLRASSDPRELTPTYLRDVIEDYLRSEFYPFGSDEYRRFSASALARVPHERALNAFVAHTLANRRQEVLGHIKEDER